jgi:hypothetical protein
MLRENFSGISILQDWNNGGKSQLCKEQRESLPGRGNSQGKGPEAGRWKKKQELSAFALARKKKKALLK